MKETPKGGAQGRTKRLVCCGRSNMAGDEPGAVYPSSQPPSAEELARIQAEAQQLREEARRVQRDWAKALRWRRRQRRACQELLRQLWERPASSPLP